MNLVRWNDISVINLLLAAASFLLFLTLEEFFIINTTSTLRNSFTSSLSPHDYGLNYSNIDTQQQQQLFTTQEEKVVFVVLLAVCFLVVSVMLTHFLVGKLYHRDQWKFWQPFVGGWKFVALQVIEEQEYIPLDIDIYSFDV